MPKTEKRYYMFTACPARCECGRVCGWRVGTERDTTPLLARLGVTAGSTGDRINGYERAGDDYFDRIGIIAVRHLDPAINRATNLADEKREIQRLRPPFNEHHNPERNTPLQHHKQMQILERPVDWLTRTEIYTTMLRHYTLRTAGYAAAALTGALTALTAAQLL